MWKRISLGILSLFVLATAQGQFFDCTRLPPDTLYYEWRGGRQLVLVDRQAAWVKYTDCLNGARPMGTDWRMRTPREPNTWLFRDSARVVAMYGVPINAEKLRPVQQSGKLQALPKSVADDAPYQAPQLLEVGGKLCWIVERSEYVFGLVDMRGGEILPAEYRQIHADKKYIYLTDNQHKTKVYDKELRAVNAPNWQVVKEVEGHKNLYMAYDEMGYWALYDDQWRLLSKKYKLDFQFHDGQAQVYDFVTINGQTHRYMGLIDTTGREIIPCAYTELRRFAKGQQATAAKIGDKWGAIDRNNRALTEFKYDFVNVYINGLAQVRVGDYNGVHYMGFIDEQGREVIAPDKYRYIGTEFREGLVEVCVGRKCGFIDREGKVVVPLIYDNIWPFERGRAKVTLDKRTFYIDKAGNEK